MTHILCYNENTKRKPIPKTEKEKDNERND